MVDLQEYFRDFPSRLRIWPGTQTPKTTMIYFHNLNRLQAGAERFIEF